MVAPHCSWPSAKRIRGELAFQRSKIKTHVKRAAVFGAYGLRTRRVDVISAFGALKVSDLGHELSLANAKYGIAFHPRVLRSAGGFQTLAEGMSRRDCRRRADCRPC